MVTESPTPKPEQPIPADHQAIEQVMKAIRWLCIATGLILPISLSGSCLGEDLKRCRAETVAVLAGQKSEKKLPCPQELVATTNNLTDCMTASTGEQQTCLPIHSTIGEVLTLSDAKTVCAMPGGLEEVSFLCFPR